ncbi:hypothetical protein [Streptomyces violaceusniger]|uniref:Uncharacterized protein n=1 Tax=Streptomyces violaceusniger (strain Tu 4113) TaxID=653045 RepID=G2PHW3_STRV4|nr:hypothetical protein [Streptomyces violaceusniger]AEM88914.1 hypothetical protein Strvi_0139 [Streptomyces violaceusniger Tu 4113]
MSHHPRRPMFCDGLDCTPTPGGAPGEWQHVHPCLRGIAEEAVTRTTPTEPPTERPPMDLDQRRDQVKTALLKDPDFIAVSEIDENSADQRVLGAETENGDLFFITIQRP